MCKLKVGQTLSVADTILSKEILNVGHPKIPKDTFTKSLKGAIFATHLNINQDKRHL